MDGLKAAQDSIFTCKSHHSFIEFKHGQGWVPVINHVRNSLIWTKFGNGYTTKFVNTETIVVRPRLKKSLRRK